MPTILQTLYLLSEQRTCDLQEFFQHENQPYPAALSDGGKRYACQKSQLASILETYITSPEKKTEVIIIDGSALVHTLPPKRRKTFEDYAALDVLPSIHAYAMKYKSTNIVFDVYNPSSLKMETRSK